METVGYKQTMDEERLINLSSALVLAQKDFTTIAKNQGVKGASYSYTYADYATITSTIRPILAKHGLAFSQVFKVTPEVGLVLKTILMHRTGGVLESEMPIFDAGALTSQNDPRNKGMQYFGSKITYARRYQLSAILGLATDDDDDANSADGIDAEIKEKRKPKYNLFKQERPRMIEAIKAGKSPQELLDWVQKGSEVSEKVAKAILNLGAEVGDEAG